LGRDQVETIIKHSSVGVCPTNYVTDFFPNKAFVYLSAGLPVLSAFQGEFKDLIKKHEIGYYYPPQNVDAIVKCIEKLSKGKEIYKKMSENAKSIYERKFNAENIYGEFATYIEKIVDNHRLENNRTVETIK